jgi:hypothetical protein
MIARIEVGRVHVSDKDSHFYLSVKSTEPDPFDTQILSHMGGLYRLGAANTSLRLSPPVTMSAARLTNNGRV